MEPEAKDESFWSEWATKEIDRYLDTTMIPIPGATGVTVLVPKYLRYSCACWDGRPTMATECRYYAQPVGDCRKCGHAYRLTTVLSREQQKALEQNFATPQA